MLGSRRPVVRTATVALALVASLLLSGYEIDTAPHHALRTHHAPKNVRAVVATAPSFVQRVVLRPNESRASRAAAFLLVAPLAAAMALVALRVRAGTVDQVGHWRINACGRRGPPRAPFAI